VWGFPELRFEFVALEISDQGLEGVWRSGGEETHLYCILSSGI